MGRLIIDGNRVYEVDELCLKRKKEQAQRRKKQIEHMGHVPREQHTRTKQDT